MSEYQGRSLTLLDRWSAMAGNWKPLPSHLPAAAAQLTEQLRAVKDQHDLSLADLAKRTHYSRASWQRWLNGERVITSSALESLIRTTGCEAEPLLGLWHRALAEDAPPAGASAATSVPSSLVASSPGSPRQSTGPDPAIEAAAGADDPARGDECMTQPTPPGQRETSVTLGPRAAEAGAAESGARRWRWRRVHALALAVALLLGGVGVMVGVVRAAGAGRKPGAVTAGTMRPGTTSVALRPSCYAAGCYGRDPQAMCAGDARTIASAHIEKAIIWMRYSPKCQAAWAKITDAVPGDQAVITNNDNQSAIALVHYGNDNYSLMVPAGSDSVLEVCGTQTDKAQACTSLIPDPAQAPTFVTPGVGTVTPSPSGMVNRAGSDDGSIL